MKFKIIKDTQFQTTEIDITDNLIPTDMVNYICNLINVKRNQNLIINNDRLEVGMYLLACIKYFDNPSYICTECNSYLNDPSTNLSRLPFPDECFILIIDEDIVIDDVANLHENYDKILNKLDKPDYLSSDFDKMLDGTEIGVHLYRYFCSETEYERCLNHYEKNIYVRKGVYITYPEKEKNIETSIRNLYNTISNSSGNVAVFTSSLHIMSYLNKIHYYSEIGRFVSNELTYMYPSNVIKLHTRFIKNDIIQSSKDYELNVDYENESMAIYELLHWVITETDVLS